MASLDVFRNSAFSTAELTASVNRAEYQPGVIESHGLFEKDGIRTTRCWVERKGNQIALIPSKPRGSQGTQHERDRRAMRDFEIPHMPYDDVIRADDVQSVRAYGSETELAGVAELTNEVLDSMRQDHEVTHEWLRVGAIKGVILDGDGATTLYDLFSEFGIVQTAVDFLLGTSTTDIKAKVEVVRRAIQAALGGLAYRGLRAYCGDSFWDKLVAHAKVEAAFARWEGNGGQGAFLRETQRGDDRTGMFTFAGVEWLNYPGKVGSNTFIPTADCRFVPLGVKGLFIERYAPADMMEFVNTKGVPVYASQELQKHQKGVDVHTQSNMIALCTIPDVLVRGHTSD